MRTLEISILKIISIPFKAVFFLYFLKNIHNDIVITEKQICLNANKTYIIMVKHWCLNQFLECKEAEKHRKVTLDK